MFENSTSHHRNCSELNTNSMFTALLAVCVLDSSWILLDSWWILTEKLDDCWMKLDDCWMIQQSWWIFIWTCSRWKTLTSTLGYRRGCRCSPNRYHHLEPTDRSFFRTPTIFFNKSTKNVSTWSKPVRCSPMEPTRTCLLHPRSSRSIRTCRSVSTNRRPRRSRGYPCFHPPPEPNSTDCLRFGFGGNWWSGVLSKL